MQKPDWSHIKDKGIRAWTEAQSLSRQAGWSKRFAEVGYDAKTQQMWLKMVRTEDDVAEAMSSENLE